MKIKSYSMIFFSFFILLFLQSCASSGAQRGLAGEADKAYITANYDVQHAADGSIADSYQNITPTTQGIVLGGATGAAAGGLSSSIGLMPGLFTGAIIGGAIGAYFESSMTLVDRLENRGVQVIELGDQIMLVMPSSAVFNSFSADIRPTVYPTLDLIAALINHYPNTAVKISAYTSGMGSCAVNLALSSQQAAKIERYLWRKEINTRILTAAGYGGAHPVTRDDGSWSSEDYRIEIIFEKNPGIEDQKNG